MKLSLKSVNMSLQAYAGSSSVVVSYDRKWELRLKIATTDGLALVGKTKMVASWRAQREKHGKYRQLLTCLLVIFHFEYICWDGNS